MRTEKLGNLAEFRNGLNYTDADNGSGLAVVGVSDFKDKVVIDTGNLPQLSLSALSKPDALIQQGDILFVRSNGNRELIGRSVYVNAEPAMPTSHSGFTIRCRFRDPRCHPRYYAYLFRGSIIRHILSAQGGGTNISNLNQQILAELNVPVPDFPMQERIAGILSAYDDLIEVNQRRIAILEDMARRLFDEWFVRFRYPGHEVVPLIETELGKVPEGWSVRLLGQLSTKVTDGSHWSPASQPAGKLMASVKDMGEWGFDLSKCRSISDEDFDKLVRNDCLPLLGDILVAKDGANLNKHTFLITEQRDDLVILSSIAIIRPNEQVEREFLTAALKSPEVSTRIKQSVSGAAIPRIILKDFKNLPLIVPPLDLQSRWVASFGPLAEQCRTLNNTNECLRAARDLLLPKLISGQIDVSVAEETFAEAAE